jgi:DNA-binding transcriptional LysR family regulator
MLDPRRLRLLVEFERRGTIAAVADALSYTPSAISQQLAALEREARVTLFEHVGRRMILTDLGRLLVTDSAEVLAALERAEANLERATGELRGAVRLATISSVGLTMLPRALAALEESHSGLAVECREAEAEEALPWLDAGEIDLVVGTRYGASASGSRYDERVLCRDPMFIALPEGHPLVTRRAVPLKQLAGARWVSARTGSAHDEMFLSACRTVGGFEPDIRHRLDNTGVIVGLVAAGAVAIVPSLGWPAADSGTVLRPASEARLEREIYSAARLSSAQRPAIEQVRQALRDAWDDLQSIRRPTHAG